MARYLVPQTSEGDDLRNLRPIFQTTCFRRALKRIILNRLMYTIQDKLSLHLRSFLPAKSTDHSFAGYLSSWMGILQGGVLSPPLSNVLVLKPVSIVQIRKYGTIIIYAEDLCLRFHSSHRLQALVDQSTLASLKCGSAISVIFSPN